MIDPLGGVPQSSTRPCPGLPELSVMAGVSAPLTPLIGREQELAHINALLRQNAVRLVTITGPGGVGKSRLAMELARSMDSDPSVSVSVIPLAGLRDADRVPAAIAQGLGIRTDDSRNALEAVAAALQDCESLLVLDNFEHVIDAAPAIVRLLEACPQLTVLISSRSVLRVSGEHDVALWPLAVPDRGVPGETRADEYSAIRLFIARASAVSASFTIDERSLSAISEICRRLDGLPLAIELAAARSTVLTPEAMIQRLGRRLPLLTGGGKDLPPHQQTMRDAIAWSHDLLTADERRVFRRLSVFPGTFSVEGAVCVASEPGRCDPPEDVPVSDEMATLEWLASLVDKSLISSASRSGGDVNFVILQTVREFGLEELAASGEESEIRWRHAQWIARLAEQREHHFVSPEDPSWMIYLLSDIEGISAAADFALSTGDVKTALRITGSLWGLWCFGGQLAEGRRLIEAALGLADPADSSLALAKALLALGMVEWISGNGDGAEMALQKANSIAVSLDDRGLHQHIHLRKSQVALYSDRIDEAEQHALRAIDIDGEREPTVWTATSRAQLGLVALHQGHLDAARQLLEQAEAEHQLTGYETGRLWTMQIIADLAHERGDRVESAMWHLASLPIAANLPNA
ncbi:MAG: AAA family ATPase, partial [Thermomicrobiales bacterium]